MQQSHETYMKVSVSGYADTDTVYACLWNSILSSLFLLGLVLCVRQITTGAYYVPVIVTCLVLPTAALLLSQRQKTRFLFWLIPLCLPIVCGILFSKKPNTPHHPLLHIAFSLCSAHLALRKRMPV